MKVEVHNQEELDAALVKHDNGWGDTQIVLAGDVTFRLSTDARVEANGTSSPRVEAYGTSSPRVEAYDTSSPTVVANGTSSPRVEAYDTSSPRVVANGTSSPRVVANGTSSPRVEANGTSSPRVEANDTSSPRVVANGTSSPTVVANGTSSPRVVANGTSSPRVEAYDTSSPTVVANGTSSPRVEAYDTSSPRVVAKAYAQLVARGPVTVDAQPTVSVVGFGRPVVRGTDRVQVVKLETPSDWCAFYGVEVVDGVATLYKAVGDDYMSPRGGNYTPGTVVEAPDWDGGEAECGGGLHFSPRPTMALAFNRDATKFVACPVALADMRAPRDSDQMPEKCKARRTCGPVYEVDRDGERVEVPGVACMSTHVTANLTITRTEFEIELELTGSVEPIQHGRYSGPPERCFPDEGGDVEVETVKCVGCGQAVELTPDEQRLAEDALYNAAARYWDIEAEDAAVDRYEGSRW